MKNVLIVGGGAAGFFCAISLAELSAENKIIILESGKKTLRKVKVSGGGRCNITHDCFDPKLLSTHYPRGQKELIGPFFKWQPKDMIHWIEANGVPTKIEKDGRVFPRSNSSQSVIDCLENIARKKQIEIRKETPVRSFTRNESNKQWDLELENGNLLNADCICIASGSIKGSRLVDSIEKLGHSVNLPIPSLFAFDTPCHTLSELSGASIHKVEIEIVGSRFKQSGPILLTHKGISGPAVIKLSSWAAKELHQKNYRFEVQINWLDQCKPEELRQELRGFKEKFAKSTIQNCPFACLPKRLWRKLLDQFLLPRTQTWAHLSNAVEKKMIQALTQYRIQIDGKSTNKEEFVTCGGIQLPEIDFTTMESKKAPNLFFAGECLDIDGVTGGFNFQSAWTTARIAALKMAS
jgi:predicted Rossmann fold flavoprotein